MARELLGVDYFADVWLNGCSLGSHEGFFSHFAFDASRWIRAGENLLVVKVDSPNDTNLKIRPIDKPIGACTPRYAPGSRSTSVDLMSSCCIDSGTWSRVRQSFPHASRGVVARLQAAVAAGGAA